MSAISIDLVVQKTANGALSFQTMIEAAHSNRTNFGDLYDQYEKINVGSEDFSNPSDKNVVEIIWKLIRQGSFMAVVLETKAALLAKGSASLLKDKNYLAAAHLIRGLLEVVGALGFLAMKLRQSAESIEGKNNPGQVKKSVEVAEAEIQKLYFGTSPYRPSDSVKAYTPGKLIKDSLGAEVYEVYDFLCEYVHPNHGSNLLVSSGSLGGGIVSASSDPPVEVIEICNALNRVIEIASNLMTERVVVLGNLVVVASRILSMGFQKALAKRKFRALGDGKSKQTAIHFEGAADLLEYAQWERDYRRKNEIDVSDDDVSIEQDEEWIYLKYPVNGHDLWIKRPLEMI